MSAKKCHDGTVSNCCPWSRCWRRKNKKKLAEKRKAECPNPMAANSNSSDECKRMYCKKTFKKYDVDASTGKSLIPPGVATHVDSCIGAALSGLPRKWWAPSQVHKSLIAQGWRDYHNTLTGKSKEEQSKKDDNDFKREKNCGSKYDQWYNMCICEKNGGQWAGRKYQRGDTSQVHGCATADGRKELINNFHDTEEIGEDGFLTKKKYRYDKEGNKIY